jgi:hypothetical protein
MSARIIAGGFAIIAALTVLGFPVVAPIAGGVAIGLAWPQRGSRNAAVAGLVAWGALLAMASTQGSLSLTMTRLGGAMGLAPWGPLLATLVYPAVLAASAAWIAGLLSPRRSVSAPDSSSRLAA